MAKRIISQHRGHGGPRYRAPSHRYVGKPRHHPLTQEEREGVVYGTIRDLVHCPGHTAPLAIIQYEDGIWECAVAPEKVQVNQKIASGSKAPVEVGNTLHLKDIPEGTLIHNIESSPGDLGKFVRTSGSSARVVSKYSNRIIIMMPSKKQKIFNPDCRATIGNIAGSGRLDKPFVKAGTKHYAMKARNKLFPKTSAGAMNATDHPFGSGRGGPTFGGKSSKSAPKNAPPGRKVGQFSPKRTGKKR